MASHTHTHSHDNNNEEKRFTYEGALDALLRSPLHQATTKEALAKTAARRTQTIDDMKVYLRRIGLDSFPNNNNNSGSPVAIIHVTGTKGKGSTCCLCESILRHHYGWNTGLFTSPHLVDIRERIRVNGLPISTTVFGQVYWQVRTRLEENAHLARQDDDSELPVLPGYFRMLTLMALFTFAHYQCDGSGGRGLDVIILEVGMGGRYDATNIVDMTKGRNIVCGVTLLDLDHTRVLGDTLEQIAWEKGGIFQTIKGRKPGDIHHAKQQEDSTENAKYFAIDTNIPSVLTVLEKCAKEEGDGRQLHLVGNCTHVIPSDAAIGLPGDHQRINAELAVALCKAVVANSSSGMKATKDGRHSLLQALAEARWPGRCQTVALKDTSVPINLRLDGSHTPISLQAGYDWFASVSDHNMPTDNAPAAKCKRILIFNCSHERNPVELLQLLLRPPSTDRGGVPVVFDVAFFCRSDFERPSAVTKKEARDLLTEQGIPLHEAWLPGKDGVTVTWQMTLESIWKHLESESKVAAIAETVANLTVAEAIDRTRSSCGAKDNAAAPAARVEVFVAGSLYIAGSALNAMRWSEEEAKGEIVIDS